MRWIEETKLRTFDTLVPKANFQSTNYRNTAEPEEQQPPPRPSSRAHRKISCHAVSAAASSRQSLKMQTKHRILTPFIRRQGFLPICKMGFREPDPFVLYTSASIKITETIMAILPTHTNPVSQNQASIQNLQFIPAIFGLVLKHIIDSTQRYHAFWRKQRKRDRTFKILILHSPQVGSAPRNAEHRVVPLRMSLGETGTEQHKPRPSPTWRGSTGLSSALSKASPEQTQMSCPSLSPAELFRHILGTAIV